MNKSFMITSCMDIVEAKEATRIRNYEVNVEMDCSKDGRVLSATYLHGFSPTPQGNGDIY